MEAWRRKCSLLSAVACVALLAEGEASGAVHRRACSNLDGYVRWADRWTASCAPADKRQQLLLGNNATRGTPSTATWFRSCLWVTCECMQSLALAPVASSELALCFEEALVKNLVVDEVKLMITALLRTCRDDATEKAKPCGECDMYREVRGCVGELEPTSTTTTSMTTTTVVESSAAARPEQPSLLFYMCAWAALLRLLLR
eukprot:TRINITY_DN14850_c0_g1_i1.p1 TRINITY_DN14850_c0_g1~~TRINITY_DN14850_c0_g1_i1.p1  ORF type:complete len:202 (+),score=43.27 TRINITY_DN14850_c0_g1_i1:233-838(+)